MGCTIVRATGRATAAVLALLTASIAARFFVLTLPDAAGEEFGRHLAGHGVALYAHAGGGIVGLLTGVGQWLWSSPSARPTVHRWMGRLYVAAIVVAATSGGLMAIRAEGGLVARSGFAVLAITWLATTATGWRCGRAARAEAHRQWMTRSVALTFGAVMLRLWLPGLQVAGLDFDTAYRISAWLAWAPNLVAVEIAHHLSLRTSRSSGS